MVQVTDPQLGETVLDPAAGTGGFLVESFSHLAAQMKTVVDRRVLQGSSLLGCEPKSLPYLLCQMNLLLHGLDAPRIDPGNALRHKLTEIGERDRVDVILTNPPFGGEEECGVQGNFPEDRQAAETALLFLQLIMRRLRRAHTAAGRPARAAVVVPNGTLFGGGVCARIKADLLEQFNLHTVLRLPEGVFAPYTDIPINVIFFDTAGPTQDVWFYEQPAPKGRRKYTKTRPLQVEELAECRAWWNDRVEGERACMEGRRAWLDPPRRGRARGRRKPRPKEPGNAGCGRSPEPGRDHRKRGSQRTGNLADTNRPSDDPSLIVSRWPVVRLEEVAPIGRRPVATRPDLDYPIISARSFGRGTFHQPTLKGSEITWERLFLVRAGDLLVSNIKAWEGAVSIVEEVDDGMFCSHRYITCRANLDRVDPGWLAAFFRTNAGVDQLAAASRGSADRNRTLSMGGLRNILVPLPSLLEQRAFVNRLNAAETCVTRRASLASAIQA